MAFRGLDRLARHQRRRFRERGEDTGGMEPAHAFLGKDLVPVDFAGLELGDSRMPSVRAPERSSDAKPTLSEVKAVPYSAPYTVILNPMNMRLVDSALV